MRPLRSLVLGLALAIPPLVAQDCSRWEVVFSGAEGAPPHVQLFRHRVVPSSDEPAITGELFAFCRSGQPAWLDVAGERRPAASCRCLSSRTQDLLERLLAGLEGWKREAIDGSTASRRHREDLREAEATRKATERLAEQLKRLASDLERSDRDSRRERERSLEEVRRAIEASKDQAHSDHRDAQDKRDRILRKR